MALASGCALRAALRKEDLIRNVLTAKLQTEQKARQATHRLVGAVMSSTPSRLKHPHCRKKHYPSSTYLTHV
ncbi:hypothetical protein Q5P01_002280 [Channa striata]|uniref:Uncharacterized protein n=1 Tax=Channa striata TaxID=64152 RepID=A0AA88NMB1_CHASR|nr:hypothetical protein Q5P01_002280 [Channa striata]